MFISLPRGAISATTTICKRRIIQHQHFEISYSRIHFDLSGSDLQTSRPRVLEIADDS